MSEYKPKNETQKATGELDANHLASILGGQVLNTPAGFKANEQLDESSVNGDLSAEGFKTKIRSILEGDDQVPKSSSVDEVPSGLTDRLDGLDEEPAVADDTFENVSSLDHIQAVLEDEPVDSQEGDAGPSQQEVYDGSASIQEVLSSFVNALEEPVNTQESRLQADFDEVSSALGGMRGTPSLLAGLQRVREQLENYMKTVRYGDLGIVIGGSLNALMASPAIQRELGSTTISAGLEDGGGAKAEGLTELATAIKKEIADFDARLKDAGAYERALYDQFDQIRTFEDINKQDMLSNFVKLKEIVSLPRTLKDRIVQLVNEAKTAM